MGMAVFQQKEPKMPGAHKIAFPAPELRVEILWTSRFSDLRFSRPFLENSKASLFHLKTREE